MSVESKESLFARGLMLAATFCDINGIVPPKITRNTGAWPYSACAFYRPGRGINIDVGKCAGIGMGGPRLVVPRLYG